MVYGTAYNYISVLQTSPSERNLLDQKEKVGDQKEKKLTEAIKGGINVQCGIKVAQGKGKETSSHDVLAK